jgi:hypothetical protein
MEVQNVNVAPIFEVGQQIIKESFNPTTPVTISKIDDNFYYTEEGIIIAIETQGEWKEFGKFKTDDEILIPGKVVRSSGDAYYITFPWAYKGTVCTCLGDEWIVPKKEGDKMFQKINTDNNG